MSSGPLVIGTAGHVDHGKTALVKALTGRDTDRLPEEKARGISIELGFAPLELPSGRAVSLVDVPGHERFVRHMVAGASGIDGYLLCVAADDGVMPQTREHVDVLRLLGVHQGVVAVTKADLIEPELAEDEVRELLGDGPEIVPVSAIQGDGMDDLAAALDRLASGLSRRTAEGRPRLFVDRSFTIAGAGTVVTGTLWGGAVAVGERVRLIPGDVEARVRGAQVHDRPADEASGGRVALNLAGVERAEVERGACVVRADDDWSLSERVDVSLDWLPDAGGPLRTRRRLQAFLGTTEVPATCVLLAGDEISPAGRGYAQLRFEGAALAVDEGDRIVLRSAERRTVGGATVLDAHPPRHGKGARQAPRLAVLEGGDAAQVAALRLREAGGEGLPLNGSDKAPDGAVVLGDRAINADVAQKARAAVLTAVGDSGIPLAAALAESGLSSTAADALLEGMVDEGVLAREGTRMIPPGLQRDPAGDAVASLLEEAGLRPPGMNELVERTGLDDHRLTAILVTLREDGRIVQAGDLWFDAAAAAGARERAAEALAVAPLGLGGLRDLWGVGRRHAMALAAYLDQSGLTRRQGEVRVLRRGASR
jgi:selenocysteine-specific elongation factor